MTNEPGVVEHIVTIRLLNSRSIGIKFYLEPWGEEYEMPPDATFDVVAKGPQGGSLEVEFGDDHITVYGWAGSVVSLFHNGTELGKGLWERSPVPSYPVS